ncbi:hypothetical protein JG688_00009754 [Phytophthora aleatoria]|uniref:Uncharacterized protein n=1 Tax=Phytophthora aleatoria TaxID=2496075 RepID=A0A8J5MFV9_9STRA|nr:hypothetical protein JG688_00009754 [Phytophthora aleatoria]
MTKVLPACSAVYMRAICPHKQLFEGEYKRSNRAGGIKVCRCFPHCCPCHVKRSYCGSPLEVSVHFDPGVQAHQVSLDATNIVVFARFEIVGEDKLPADIFSLRSLRSTCKGDSSVEAPWIEGVRQLTYQQQGSLTFMLNGEPYDKWYYHWESSSHKTQRATKHVLRAYVFYQVPGCQDMRPAEQGNLFAGDILDLLCFVDSPPFTLVSYRRSSKKDSIKLTGTQNVSDNTAIPISETGTIRRMDTELGHRFQSQERSEQTRYFDVASCADEAPPPSRTQREQLQHDLYRQFQEREGLEFWLLTPEDAALSEPLLHSQIESQEQRLVFHRHREGNLSFESDEGMAEGLSKEGRAESVEITSAPETFRQPEQAAVQPFVSNHRRQSGRNEYQLQQLTDLAIIHCCVSHFTTRFPGDAENVEMAWAKAIYKYWSFEGGDAVHLARMLQNVSRSENIERTFSFTGSTNRRLEEILQVLAEICVWVFSPENIQFAQALLAECYPLLDRSTSGHYDTGSNLCTAFLRCVERCWSSLDEFLQTHLSETTIRSVRDLSDAVLGVVYGDPALEELRPKLRAVVDGLDDWFDDNMNSHTSGSPHCKLVGWRGFVAQVREVFLVQQCSTHHLPVQLLNAPNRWTGDWLLRPSTLAFTLHTDQGSSTRIPSHDGTSMVSITGCMSSMWTSCLVLSQLVHLKLTVVGDPLHTVNIQAESSLLSPNSSWMRLICDGRIRVAPVAPNGLTSLLPGSSYLFGGDYIAHYLQLSQTENYSFNASARSTAGGTGVLSMICLEFYWWPLRERTMEADRVAYRMVMTLKTYRMEAFLDGRACFERGLVDQDAVMAATTPHLELWTPTERVQLAKSWEQWLTVEGRYART